VVKKLAFETAPQQISISSLSQGVYLVKVYTDAGVAVRKVVKSEL
jgi:hypothetical protein